MDSTQNILHLDDFLPEAKEAGDFITCHITPVIARKDETQEAKKEWTEDIAVAMALGVLLKLAKAHRSEVQEYLNQAKKFAWRMMIDDLPNHPQETLSEKLDRWRQKLLRLPKAEIRRSRGTREERYSPEEALLLLELSLRKLKEIQAQCSQILVPPILEGPSPKEIAIRDELKKNFPWLSKKQHQSAAWEIANQSPINATAEQVTAWLMGLENIEHLKNRYLRPAKQITAAIDNALKKFE